MFKQYLQRKYLGVLIAILFAVLTGAIYADAENFYLLSGPIGGIAGSSQITQGLLTQTSVQTNATAKLPSPRLTAYSAIHCADAVNGLDTNTGVAAGTYPNFTNCVKTAAKLATLITASSWNGLTGVFRDSKIGSVQSDMLDIPGAAVGGTASVPTMVTSYGPALFNDPISGATGGAIIDGADCLGANSGNCANVPNLPPSWTPVARGVYKTSYAAPITSVFIDNIQTWEDGATPNTPLSGGLTPASCLSGTCAGGVTAASKLNFWRAGHSGGYGAGTAVQNPGGTLPPANWWFTWAGGTPATSGSGPTWATGMTAGISTVTDGTITWIWEGNASGKIGAMAHSASGGSWFWDGNFLYVETARGDSPANHVIEATNHEWGIKSDANAPNNNFFDVGHIEMRHFAEDGMLWRNDSTTTCPTGFVWFDNFITQTGPTNVDLAWFGNGFRFVDNFTLANAANTCATSGASFIHNQMSYQGDHGGNLTLQIGNLPVVEAWNNLSHGDHGIINNVGAASISCHGCQIIGNFVHDQIMNFNHNVAADSNGGIFQAFGGPLTVVGNYVRNIYDPTCVGGSCVCFDFQHQNTGAATVENNTCDSSQEGLYVNANTSGGGTIFKGNICSNLIKAASTATCITTHNTIELASSDYNLTGGGPTFSFNGVQQNLATWQTKGYDTHSVNSAPSYSSSGYPYQLAPGSPGIGLTRALGFWGENAGANQLVNGRITIAK